MIKDKDNGREIKEKKDVEKGMIKNEELIKLMEDEKDGVERGGKVKKMRKKDINMDDEDDDERKYDGESKRGRVKKEKK